MQRSEGRLTAPVIHRIPMGTAASYQNAGFAGNILLFAVGPVFAMHFGHETRICECQRQQRVHYGGWRTRVVGLFK